MSDDIIYPVGYIDTNAVPEQISPAQLRRALTHFGMRDSVEAAVAASDQDTKDWYSFATYFIRSHPRVVAMGEAVGATPADMDNIWRYGASLL